MVIGGLLSLSDRRLRVGAPKPGRKARRDCSRRSRRHALAAAHHRSRSSLGAASPALAVQPDEVLTDPALEARARALSKELRCMVCQNQSIDDSDAPLARDLRVLVRERLQAGDSDAQVLDFLVKRYGEFVLLKPRFSAAHRAAVADAGAGSADRRRRSAAGVAAHRPAPRPIRRPRRARR